MGGVVSKLFGRGYRTNETGSSVVPGDAPDTPSETGNVSTPTEAAQDVSKGGSKPDVARVGVDKLPDARPPETIPPKASRDTNVSADKSAVKKEETSCEETKTSEATKVGQPLSKKPSVLETAKEDVLGVFESMKKNVGAAKGALFDRSTKSDQQKPTASKSVEQKPQDVPVTKKTNEEEGKTESFLQKLGFGKEEHKPAAERLKEKASDEAVSKPPSAEKQPRATFLEQLSQEASVLAEAPASLEQKAQGALDAGKADAELLSTKVTTIAADASESLKQKSEEVLDVGKAHVQSLKQKSQETLDVGKSQAQSLKQKSEEVVNLGKATTEQLKHKAQDVVESGKEGADNLKQKVQGAVHSGSATVESLKQKSSEAIGETRKIGGDLKLKTEATVDVGRAKVESLLQQVQPAVDSTTERLEQKTQEVLDAGKTKTESLASKSREVVDASKDKVEQLKQNVTDAARAAKAKTDDLGKEAHGVAQDLKQKSEQAMHDAKAKMLSAQASAAEALASEKAKAGSLLPQVSPTFLAAPEFTKEATKSDSNTSDLKFSEAADASEKLCKPVAEDSAAAEKATSEQLMEKARETYDSAKEKADSFFQQLKPTVVEVSESLKQKSQAALTVGMTTVESCAHQVKEFALGGTDLPAAEKEDTAPENEQLKQIVEDTTTKEDSPKGDFKVPSDSEKEPVGSLLEQVQSSVLGVTTALGLASITDSDNRTDVMKDEPKTEVPHLGEPTQHGPSVVGNVCESVKLKSLDAVEAGKTAIESVKAASQEAFDATKSKAEVLVEHVISSVVGATESLKNTSEATFNSEKDKINYLKEKAQQEFDTSKEKAEQLLQHVEPLVTTTAESSNVESTRVAQDGVQHGAQITETAAKDVVRTNELQELFQLPSLSEPPVWEEREQITHEIEGSSHKAFAPVTLEPVKSRFVQPVELAPGQFQALSAAKDDHGALDAAAQQASEQLLNVADADRRSQSPNLEDIETAVVKIQAGVRGYLARKNLHERSPQRQQDNPSFGAAGELENEDPAAGIPEASSTEMAATKIQAAFRGYRVRKELKPDNGPSGGHKEDRELVESR